jgi:hypothetical protein
VTKPPYGWRVGLLPGGMLMSSNLIISLLAHPDLI